MIPVLVEAERSIKGVVDNKRVRSEKGAEMSQRTRAQNALR